MLISTGWVLRRGAPAAVAAFAAAVLALGPASSSAATPGECALHSLPYFTAQGAGKTAASVADVVEVNCAQEAGQPVTVEDPQLYGKCGNQLSWAQPVPYAPASGPSFKVTLDQFSNATLVLWGTGCRAGETQVTSKLGVAPFTNANGSLTVLAPAPIRPGLYALPGSQVEGAGGTLATIIQAGFEHAAEEKVEFSGANLYHRCRTRPHVHWIYQGKEKAGAKSVRMKLDNDGSGFAIVLAGPGCMAGESLLVAELVEKPYRAVTTSFSGLPPQEVL